jgi:hypothetical protein
LALAYELDLKQSRPFDLILKHHHGMTHPVPPRWVEKKQRRSSRSCGQTKT